MKEFKRFIIAISHCLFYGALILLPWATACDVGKKQYAEKVKHCKKACENHRILNYDNIANTCECDMNSELKEAL